MEPWLELTHDGFLSDHRSKQRRSRNPLGLLQALVKCGSQRSIAAFDLGRNGKDGVKSPRGALHETFKGVVAWIEQRDEKMAAREKTASGEYNTSTPQR